MYCRIFEFDSLLIPIVRVDEIFSDIVPVSQNPSQATSLQWFSIGKIISATSLCQADDALGFDKKISSSLAHGIIIYIFLVCVRTNLIVASPKVNKFLVSSTYSIWQVLHTVGTIG